MCSDLSIRFIEQSDGVCFDVKVVPGSSRDRIVGALGDALKIAVSKPAHGGAANAAVVALLAATLGLPLGAVTIARGHGSARKQIRVRGISRLQVAERLAARD